MDLKASIKKATRYLESLMGPASEGLCIQLERCKSESDFLAKVSEVQRILAISRSEKKAAEFVAATLGP